MKKVFGFCLITGLIFSLLFSAPVFAVNPLPVKFLSQADPPGNFTTEDYDSRNCGQACCVMIEAFYNNQDPISKRIMDVDDWLYDKYGAAQDKRNYYGSFTTATILADILKNMMGFQNAIVYTDQTI